MTDHRINAYKSQPAPKAQIRLKPSAVGEAKYFFGYQLHPIHLVRQYANFALNILWIYARLSTYWFLILVK